MAKKKATGAQANNTESGFIDLQRLQDSILDLPIIGLAPLIPHKWSEKAIRMLPGYSGDQIKTKKGSRNPEEEAEDCLYRLEDGRLGMPATAFKAAIVGACRFFKKPSMTEAKLLFFVMGEGLDSLVPIAGEPVLRQDLPRNSNGSPDIRYRYAIHNWRATLKIRFVASSITPSSVVTLVDAAGRLGVGDWRPSAPNSATGTFGTWRVDTDEQEAKS